MKFNWEYFFQTLPEVASKLDVTLGLTLAAAFFSLLLGIVFALIAYYKVPVLSQLLKVWSSFMRGTPAIAQLFFFYYGLANVSSVILQMSPLVAVAVIMSLHMSCFMGESIRAALISVDDGQRDAAKAFGMTGFQMTVRVVLPQAIRVALPPLFNDLISLFKLSSLAYLVGLRDVMGAAKIEANNTYQFFECYACVIVVYWAISLVLMGIQKILEKRCSEAY
ncbi:MAG: amino acid ABC transporter permease [Eggerthellaceae bacterium]|uniref:Putative amino-acid transport system permease protein n=1 Tax=Denitrobacterium detoxificans TaxID=79604 RepID=A0A172RW08_9ACTN|nr:amino acid ABC transporter permease [Denitrobacterium detoxificans]ANE21908.1 ABC transporter permease [Denitrobacterium detoxificans]MBE6466158.1 amino acid ABC transporter permease [Denitrobacterium detoxificans]MCR5583363.1 amino acid ABC transporter permease [Eggerthellaceae bacterium]SEO45218.1 putative amino-acid transport system permease protein [Denitrobacterium detoxificans]